MFIDILPAPFETSDLAKNLSAIGIELDFNVSSSQPLECQTQQYEYRLSQRVVRVVRNHDQPTLLRPYSIEEGEVVLSKARL